MWNAELAPELADTAEVLSHRLRAHLNWVSELLLPHAATLERRYLARLRTLGYPPLQRSALAAMSLGAAIQVLAQRRSLLKFIEQVEYSGRRLAKMNLPPSAILAALREYDLLLNPLAAKLPAADLARFEAARDQMRLCVILTVNNACYQVGEAERQAFHDLSRVELESRNLDELLKKFVDTIVPAVGAGAGQLYLLNETRAMTAALRRKLSRTRCDAVAVDPTWRKRFQSCWSLPLVANGVQAGVLQLGFRRHYEWLPRERAFLIAAGERCLLATEKARLLENLVAREEQVRQLAAHMLEIEERERRRISRELHDETGQSLLCIRLQTEMLEQSLPENHEWKAKLAETRELTERTIIEMRRLIAALSPSVLEKLGLGAALRQLVQRFRRVHRCRVRLHIARLAALPAATEMVVYRLVQECSNNIAKHSGATEVNISIHSSDKKVRVNVADNGAGFEVEAALARRDAFGLSGMRERVALLGGKFEVQSSPGRKGGERGTMVRIELPVPLRRAAREGARKRGLHSYAQN